LPELREDVLELVLRNSDAAVLDAIEQCLPFERDTDLDGTLPGELQRVAGQIQQALGNAFSIPGREGDVLLHVGNESQPLLRSQGLQ
jgi:hypothetical protein